MSRVTERRDGFKILDADTTSPPSGGQKPFRHSGFTQPSCLLTTEDQRCTWASQPTLEEGFQGCAHDLGKRERAPFSLSFLLHPSPRRAPTCSLLLLSGEQSFSLWTEVAQNKAYCSEWRSVSTVGPAQRCTVVDQTESRCPRRRPVVSHEGRTVPRSVTGALIGICGHNSISGL